MALGQMCTAISFGTAIVGLHKAACVKAGIEPIGEHGVSDAACCSGFARYRGRQALRRDENFDHTDLLGGGGGGGAGGHPRARAQGLEIAPRARFLILETGWLGRAARTGGSEKGGRGLFGSQADVQLDLVSWLRRKGRFPCLVTDTGVVGGGGGGGGSPTKTDLRNSRVGIMLPLHGVDAQLGVVFTERLARTISPPDCARESPLEDSIAKAHQGRGGDRRFDSTAVLKEPLASAPPPPPPPSDEWMNSDGNAGRTPRKNMRLASEELAARIPHPPPRPRHFASRVVGRVT